MSRIVVRGGSFEEIVENVSEEIKHQMESRSYRAANVLRNSALEVLRGQRGGRRYRVPGKKTYYTASAPGEPPAARTGLFRISWQPTAHKVFGSYISRIESDRRTDNGRFTLGDILENGTPGGQMAPRPHQEKIQEHAEPKIFRIYDAPYFNE